MTVAAGFSQDTMTFFKAIQFNNNKAFFEENRALFERAVHQPLVALAETLVPVVSKIDPQIDTRPQRAVSRIYRDVRFSKDKSPYRDYMWIGFRRIGETREATCGFYFDISAEAAHWGCGYYHMQPQTMQNFRQKLMDEPKRVLRILNDPAFAGRFAVLGDAYVRQHQPPEGMPEALGMLYRKKAIYAEHGITRMEDVFAEDLADTIAKDFQALAPFYELMRECMAK